jgi:hypothetical protein
MTPNSRSRQIKSGVDSGLYLTGRSAKAILLRGRSPGGPKVQYSQLVALVHIVH